MLLRIHFLCSSLRLSAFVLSVWKIKIKMTWSVQNIYSLPYIYILFILIFNLLKSYRRRKKNRNYIFFLCKVFLKIYKSSNSLLQKIILWDHIFYKSFIHFSLLDEIHLVNYVCGFKARAAIHLFPVGIAQDWI